MAIESIAEEYAKFHGYLTETRVPFKLGAGHSDFDVLGYNPSNERTLVIECKATGKSESYPKKHYDFEQVFAEILERWEMFKASPTNRWKLKNLNEAWFIAPISNDGDIDEISKNLGQKFAIVVRILPIHKLLIDILVEVKNDKDIRRKRYQNPALEYCRWLLRTMEAKKLSLSYIDAILNKGENTDAQAPSKKESKENVTYEDVIRQYLRAALRLVRENAKEAQTRECTIRALHALDGSGTVPQIEKKAVEMGFDMNSSRVNHGLSTWMNLGIVAQEPDGTYCIHKSFKKIIGEVIDEKEQDYANEEE